ncbi:hypothetical protein GCM10010435_82970 [Winogradskya consettensis]|uniref:Guanylate cyclase domain-containing protein n=1 Tax=Winogradskya consettensis TaxID=113560 RepID=A0A919SWF3_9ACTN|nr:hypothetical protein [Actinoplanes consettensis]GIM79244.1 hypothetical protein Aco04nite_64540 [Actinoplanes consettensis]
MGVAQHFSIVVLDIEASGSLSGPEKTAVRNDLYEIVTTALDLSAVAAESVTVEDRGDGIFLLFDATVSKRQLLDPFLATIDEALRARRVGAPALRLRMVVHHGEAVRDDHGSSGAALDLAFAMVDSEELRSALRDARGGRMAVVVPDELYHGVVRGYPSPDPGAFRMRRLGTKRGPLRTWVTVTGASEQPGSPRREPAVRPVDSTAVPVMRVDNRQMNKIKGDVGVVGGTNSGTINIGGRPHARGDH